MSTSPRRRARSVVRYARGRGDDVPGGEAVGYVWLLHLMVLLGFVLTRALAAR